MVSAVVYVLTLSCVLLHVDEPDRYLTLMASDVANVQYFSRLTTFQSVIIEFILQFAVEVALSPFLQLGQVTIPSGSGMDDVYGGGPPDGAAGDGQGDDNTVAATAAAGATQGFF